MNTRKRGKEKKIKALHDFSLRTYYGEHHLIEGEVKLVRFKNNAVVEELLKFKHFVLAHPDEPESRVIPVLLPEVDEDSLVGVEDGLVITEDDQILPPVELIDNDISVDENEADHGNETQNSRSDPTN